jgi:hypothetical protein
VGVAGCKAINATSGLKYHFLWKFRSSSMTFGRYHCCKAGKGILRIENLAEL